MVQSIFPFYLEKTQLPAEKITRGNFSSMDLLSQSSAYSGYLSQSERIATLLCLTLPVSGGCWRGWQLRAPGEMIMAVGGGFHFRFEPLSSSGIFRYG